MRKSFFAGFLFISLLTTSVVYAGNVSENFSQQPPAISPARPPGSGLAPVENVPSVYPPETNDAALKQDLMVLMNSDKMRDNLHHITSVQWRALVGNDCPKLNRIGMDVYVKKYPDKSYMDGEWKLIQQIQGCGETRQFNILYQILNGHLVVTAMLPGTSKADARLQQDAMVEAHLGMTEIAPKDCAAQSYQYINAEFVGFEPLPNALTMEQKPWKENWTINACGVKALVSIHFMPNASGTAIFVDPKETELVSNL